MTDYLPYCGIGSRSTPPHIQNVMRHVAAYLASVGWTLRSGGANGADLAFEVGVNDFEGSKFFNGTQQMVSRKEIYLPWAGFNNNPSNLHPRAIPFAEDEIEISRMYHPAWDKCSPSAKLLHQRNLRQLLGHESVCGPQVQPSKFVICWTENGALVGGTAQALRIATAMDIPIINFGLAHSAEALEKMVLAIDEVQKQFNTPEVATNDQG